jgi:hypothetical protein
MGTAADGCCLSRSGSASAPAIPGPRAAPHTERIISTDSSRWLSTPKMLKIPIHRDRIEERSDPCAIVELGKRWHDTP